MICADSGEQAPAGRRKRHARTTSVSNSVDAEPFLQRLDVPGDGGLAQMQRFGGPREVAELGNGNESAKLVEIQGTFPSWLA